MVMKIASAAQMSIQESYSDIPFLCSRVLLHFLALMHICPESSQDHEIPIDLKEFHNEHSEILHSRSLEVFFFNPMLSESS